MSSLADFPEVVGFFSYSRDDDEDFGHQLSSLRDAIHKELAAALGRNKRNFRLWQDQDAIAPGEMWEAKIASAINEATFFIPIVTPRAVGSEHCKFEFDAFLARERALGRNNLVFPILYMTVPPSPKTLSGEAIRYCRSLGPDSLWTGASTDTCRLKHPPIEKRSAISARESQRPSVSSGHRRTNEADRTRVHN
jgi:TIR domain